MSEEDEENAAELQFGPEFSDKDVQFLTNDEVFYLLLKKVKSGQSTDTFQQTFHYLEKVATTKNEQDLAKVAGELATRFDNQELELSDSRKKVKLHKFEVASLSNLIRADETTADEAQAWIPSLTRFDDEEIIKAVDIVVSAKESVSENTV